MRQLAVGVPAKGCKPAMASVAPKRLSFAYCHEYTFAWNLFPDDPDPTFDSVRGILENQFLCSGYRTENPGKSRFRY